MALRTQQTVRLSEESIAFSWADTLAFQSEAAPDKTAFLYLPDGEHDGERLTYGALHRRAATIAAWLRREGLEGKRVLILHPPGVEFIAAFLGCLAGNVVAVPVYPPNPARPDATLARLIKIAEDCEPAAALVSAAQRPKLQGLGDLSPALRSVRWMDSESIGTDPEAPWAAPDADSNVLAFLQYTSGSTTEPKGVRVTHRNITHNARRIGAVLSVTGQSRGLSWLPPYHDMGLIGHVLNPLFFGIESIIMPPVAFLQRPMRWLDAISRFRATISYAPNFAYELVLRKVRPEHLARLDLSCWASAGNGAEPVRAETLERFCATFEPCGFRRETFCPSYGLAECTLLASGGHGTRYRFVSKAALEHNVVTACDPASSGARTVVSMGDAGRGMHAVIADPDTLTTSPAGRVGEIWLRGESIADGYFRRPEETRATFGARLTDTGEGPFLRTGDLGFLQDGELYITGRLKDLIIVDGRNHYPQDIEQTVELVHPSLRSGGAIAFSIDADGTEHLVVVAERSRGSDDGALAEAGRSIRTAVAEQHGLRLHALVWVAPGSLPRTGSGKPRRRACRTAYLDRTLKEASVRT